MKHTKSRMYSEFFQGFLFSFFLLASWNYAIKSKINFPLIVKFVQALLETYKKPAHTTEVKQEGKLLKLEALDNTLCIPTIETKHLYDVVCYQDPEHRIKFPITFFQYKNEYIYIPFKPKDLSLTHLFVGIKQLVQDSYHFFEVQENEFVDIPSYITRYENEILTETSELAEAYD